MKGKFINLLEEFVAEKIHPYPWLTVFKDENSQGNLDIPLATPDYCPIEKFNGLVDKIQNYTNFSRTHIIKAYGEWCFPKLVAKSPKFLFFKEATFSPISFVEALSEEITSIHGESQFQSPIIKEVAPMTVHIEWPDASLEPFFEGILEGLRFYFDLDVNIQKVQQENNAIGIQIIFPKWTADRFATVSAHLQWESNKMAALEQLIESQKNTIFETKQCLQYASFFENRMLQEISDSVILINQIGEVINANPAAHKLLGYDENEMLGKCFSEIMLLPQEKTGTDLYAYLQELTGSQREITYKTKEKKRLKVFFNAMSVELPSGMIKASSVQKDNEFYWAPAIVCIAENISDRLEVFEQLWNLAKFPNENPNPVMRISNEGKLSFANKASNQLLKHWHCSVNQPVSDVVMNLVKDVGKGGIKEVEVSCGDTSYNALFTLVTGENYINIYATDITLRKNAEKQLIHDAFYDNLTSLPNRALFMDRLKQTINFHSRPKNFLYAVLFLDVDRFKVINDSLGHLIGDQLLVAVSKRLLSCIRPEDTLARLGGDEFTILLDNIKSEKSAIIIANRILEELKNPFLVDSHEIFVTTSIGIALSSSGYEVPEELLRDADTAMYAAKSQGKAQYVIFDRKMHEKMMKILVIENQLRRSMGTDEFKMYFQPKIDLKTRGISGFEALIRWFPNGQFISPVEFIPIAEETGMIVPLGEWIIRNVTQQIIHWKNMGIGDIPVAINCSGKQFQQHDFINSICTILEEEEVSPHLLEIEITESTLMDNIESTINKLNELVHRGFRISIDDFGTGYSSLRYLKTFPLDVLKVDKSFIDDVLANPDDAAITSAIIAMAHKLKLKVVAEGVETEDQLSYLSDLNCDQVQGYFFSKPVPAEDVPTVISNFGLFQAQS